MSESERLDPQGRVTHVPPPLDCPSASIGRTEGTTPSTKGSVTHCGSSQQTCGGGEDGGGGVATSTRDARPGARSRPMLHSEPPGSSLAYEYSGWLPAPHHRPSPSSVPQKPVLEQQWRHMASPPSSATPAPH